MHLKYFMAIYHMFSSRPTCNSPHDQISDKPINKSVSCQKQTDDLLDGASDTRSTGKIMLRSQKQATTDSNMTIQTDRHIHTVTHTHTG